MPFVVSTAPGHGIRTTCESRYRAALALVCLVHRHGPTAQGRMEGVVPFGGGKFITLMEPPTDVPMHALAGVSPPPADLRRSSSPVEAVTRRTGHCPSHRRRIPTDAFAWVLFGECRHHRLVVPVRGCSTAGAPSHAGRRQCLTTIAWSLNVLDRRVVSHVGPASELSCIPSMAEHPVLQRAFSWGKSWLPFCGRPARHQTVLFGTQIHFEREKRANAP